MNCRHLIVILATLGAFVCCVSAEPIGYAVDTGNPGGDLYRVDLATGAVTLVGPLGLTSSADVEAIDFDPTTGVLYAFDDAGSGLYTLDLNTGAATSVGGDTVILNAGLSFNDAGQGYLVSGTSLLSLDKLTGATTLIGSGAEALSSSAFIGNTPYALADNESSGPSNLMTVDVTSGAQSVVGPLGFVPFEQTGMDYDPVTNRLYAINEDTAGIYIIDPGTGSSTFVASHPPTVIFESLAVVPEPAGAAGLAVAALLALRRRQNH